MRPVIRYQSQLLYRKSYKPSRVIRIRPARKTNLAFRPARASPIEVGNKITGGGVMLVLSSTPPLQDAAFKNCCLFSGRYDGRRRKCYFRE